MPTTERLTQREILKQIALKRANRPQVDNQGQPIGDEPRPLYRYDENGRFVGMVSDDDGRPAA